MREITIFAPKVVTAPGEENIVAQSISWADSLIIALLKDPKDSDNRHVDGNSFVRGPSHLTVRILSTYSHI
jgi:hypothetical protein